MIIPGLCCHLVSLVDRREATTLPLAVLFGDTADWRASCHADDGVNNFCQHEKYRIHKPDMTSVGEKSGYCDSVYFAAPEIVLTT